MKRNTKVLTISVSPEEERDLNRAAKKQNLNRSQIIREAFRTYLLDRELDEIQKYGEKLAMRLGIDTEDDVEKIAG
jgi:metal-responsive CopG/Arc/MetJ family transcriptional regulator